MKRIVLLSDGTGNSSATLFKTNVWRMYQALDLETEHNGVRQIACYNDGVGTSAFRPLALLGGAFGYGLKRNVLHLYEFLCQNWEDGDEIYIFGFSRGAFTGRVLAGLIANKGVLVNCNPKKLHSRTRHLYREFRFARYQVVSLPPVVLLAHLIRRGLTWAWRTISGKPRPDVVEPDITFLGVWDTVAAYGSPLAELTRGIDRFVFPLSMPDRKLNDKILRARHALALDDERDTFHPLLWDEIDKNEPWNRLQQVWFAGMHADVGGGYPDDALSFPPLEWMMKEASAGDGLKYLDRAYERFAPPPSQSAVLHDSRQGLSGYYRYQPRRLSAYLCPDDPETAVMRDSSRKAKAHVKRITLHHSATDRISRSTDRYAPIVMPEFFDVLNHNGDVVSNVETPDARTARMTGQKRVWDLVWHKRVNYFLMVGVSIVFAALPFWAPPPASAACEWLGCSVSPIIRMVGAFVPAFLQTWIDAIENHPGGTIGFAALLSALLLRSASLQRQLQDLMWRLWAALRNEDVPEVSPPTSWVFWLLTRPWCLKAIALIKRPPPVPRVSWVHWWRTRPWYLWTVAAIKWWLLPYTLGLLALAVVIVGAFCLVATPVLRQQIAKSESDGSVCGLRQHDQPDADFHTNMTCWPFGTKLLADNVYRVEMRIKEPWLDNTLPASPVGIEAERMPALPRYLGPPFRRTISGRWFQPFVTILSDDNTRHVQPLDFVNEGGVYVARFVPAESGSVLLWVNDSVAEFSWAGVLAWPYRFTSKYYANNHGSAAVEIVPAAPGAAK